MKRTVALAILGMAVASTAFGQGHIQLSNYAIPYSGVSWGANTGNSGRLPLNAPITLQLFYGAGNLSSDAGLLPGSTFTINSPSTYNGGGYFTVVQQVPTVEGYTFQVRAVGGTTPNGPVDEALSRSGLFFVAAPPIVSTAYPINGAFSDNLSLTVFAVIPEPSTFALAGLGAAALLIFRRRD